LNLAEAKPILYLVSAAGAIDRGLRRQTAMVKMTEITMMTPIYILVSN
jgi:hypothetical protein